MAVKIAVLGSTGSIGVQTLDVARNLNLEILALTANSNLELLEAQAREFKPRVIAAFSEKTAEELKDRLKGLDIQIYSGIDGNVKAAVLKDVDTVVVAIVGIAGLIPTVEAIRNKKNIALANKETLVTAGNIIIDEVKKNNTAIMPVDSEHSAIFQCLSGNNVKNVSRIILTASGGPFRGKDINELRNVTLKEALNHPNWNMGNKITIDSATLMNKGLEVIEARWLFGLPAKKINVLVHPQSIIHSMVEYVDGSIIAQIGPPDMRLPIQYALTYPERQDNDFSRLDLAKYRNLTFEEPDYNAFPCLRLAYDALNAGGTMPAVLNAANEAAVGLFLDEAIGFTDIPYLIENVMERHNVNNNPSLDDIINIDVWARDELKRQMAKKFG